MKRVFDPEILEMMDRPDAGRRELAEALENLRRINAWFGSHRMVRRFLRCWLEPGRSYRILDLATGYGDIPRAVIDWARRRGIHLEIDAVDNHPLTLELAREASAGYPEIDYVRGDARQFEPGVTYDVVLCTLALHHFAEEDAARVLRHAAALSHSHVLVSDLERSRLSCLGVALLTRCLLRHPITRHDAVMSVKRAFSFREMAALAEEAGWEEYGQARVFPARQAVWSTAERGAPVIDVTDTAPGFA